MKSKMIGRLLSLSLSVVLAISTFSVPAFAAEEEIALTEEESTSEDELRGETNVDDADYSEDETYSEEETSAEEETSFEVEFEVEDEESFFEEELIEEEIIDEDIETEADAAFEAWLEDITVNDVSGDDVSGNDISGNDSKKEYSITYDFTVDGKPASEEVLATITNPNTMTSFIPEGGSMRYFLEAAQSTSNLVFTGWNKNGIRLNEITIWDSELEEDVTKWVYYLYAHDGDVTFTGKFVTSHEVTLDYNIGTQDVFVKESVMDGKTLETEEPVNTGYFFKGWYTEKEEGKGTKVDLKKTPITGDVTYYAHWELVTYTVNYHLDADAKSKAVSKTYTIKDSGNESIGFEAIFGESSEYAEVLAKKDSFEGWTSDKDFYSAKQNLTAGYLMFCEGATAATMIIELYPQWARDSYTVVFDATGGETIDFYDEYFDDSTFSVEDNSDLQQTKTFYVGEGVILTGREFVRGGYKLKGWKSSASKETVPASGKLKDLGKKGDTITLTAIWEAQTYTITYDFNGGKAIDKAKYPNKVTYTKATTPDWTPLYNHTFYEYINEEGYEEKTTRIDEENPVVVKEGYRFGHWQLEGGGSKDSYGGWVGYENFKVKAYWYPVYYYLDFDLDGAKDSSGWTGGRSSYSYGYEIDLAKISTRLSKAGYTLTGWKYDSNDNGMIDDGDKTVGAKAKLKKLTATNGKTIKIKALWKANSNTITYSNGKGAKQQNAVKKYATGEAVAIASPTREGYTFTGYTVSAKDKKASNALLKAVDDSDPTKGYTLLAGSYGNIVLTANWLKTSPAASTYKIVILPGAAGVKTSDGAAVDEKTGITYKNGEEAKYEDITTVLGTPDFVREGFVFKGYSYKKNGSIIENAVVGGHDAKNGVVTLYAVWTARTNSGILSTTARVDNNASNKLSVSAEINAIKLSKRTFTYGKALTLPKVTVAGYKFLGWELKKGSSDGLTKDKTGKYIKKIGKDYKDDTLLLTPVFEQSKVKITIDPQGGSYEKTGSEKVVYEVYYKSDINALIDDILPVTKKNAKLDGFYLDAKGTKYFANYDGTASYIYYRATKDMTIYAVWKDIKPQKPVNVSAELKGTNLWFYYKDQRTYTNVEVQYATDSKFTKSVNTYDMGSAGYNGTEQCVYATASQYYARFRTYDIDSTGTKIYSDWSDTVMAIRDAAPSDAE